MKHLLFSATCFLAFFRDVICDSQNFSVFPVMSKHSGLFGKNVILKCNTAGCTPF